MERRALGRDFGLTVRMALVGAVIAVLYLILAGLAVAVVLIDPSEWEAWLVPVVVAAAVWGHYAGADKLVLRAVRARFVDSNDEPELHTSLDRLCALADVPKPRLAVSPLAVPNALAVGTTPRRATIVLTDGIRGRLSPSEVDAVLAHELAHIANRDALVVTAASLFPTLGAYLGRWRFGGSDFRRRDRDRREWILWPFLMLLAVALYGLGGLLTFAISRYREYAADRGAAILTGAPEYLMSALQKVSNELETIPKRDLRAVAALNAFFIVSAKRRRFELLMDHPPLEKRLRELSELARDLGKAGG